MRCLLVLDSDVSAPCVCERERVSCLLVVDYDVSAPCDVPGERTGR